MYYVPKDRLGEVEASLREWGYCRHHNKYQRPGCDSRGSAGEEVSGRIHLLHASSRFKKVIISEETLEDYLAKNKSATGIMLVRPLW